MHLCVCVCVCVCVCLVVTHMRVVYAAVEAARRPLHLSPTVGGIWCIHACMVIHMENGCNWASCNSSAVWKKKKNLVWLRVRTGLKKRVFALRSCCLRPQHKVICLSDTQRWSLLVTGSLFELFSCSFGFFFLYLYFHLIYFFIVSGNHHIIF